MSLFGPFTRHDWCVLGAVLVVYLFTHPHIDKPGPYATQAAAAICMMVWFFWGRR